MRKSNHEQKLVWKDQAAETYVKNLVTDNLKLNEFDLATDGGNVDSAYDTLARLIENAASDANMISRGRPARAKLNLLMPPWFDSTCRAMKAHLRRLTKPRQPTRTLKMEYNSLRRRKRRSHNESITRKVTNLIEARDVQVFCGQGQWPNTYPGTCMDRLLERTLCTKTNKYTKRSDPKTHLCTISSERQVTNQPDYSCRHSHSTRTRRQVQKGIQKYQLCLAEEP